MGEICRDFQKGTCYREGCRYSHADPGRGGGGDRGGGGGFGFDAMGFGGAAGGGGGGGNRSYEWDNNAPRGAGAGGQQPTPGDWVCGPCDTLNFKRRDDCCKCFNNRSERSMDITSGNIREYLERRQRQEDRARRREEKMRELARGGGGGNRDRRRGREGGKGGRQGMASMSMSICRCQRVNMCFVPCVSRLTGISLQIRGASLEVSRVVCVCKASSRPTRRWLVRDKADVEFF